MSLFDRMASRPLTGQQRAFMDAVRSAVPGDARRGIALDAKAGTGKTTALVAAAEALLCGTGRRPKVLVLCFNNSVQKELQARLPQGAVARTFHTFGREIIDASGIAVSFNQKRAYAWLEANYSQAKRTHYALSSMLQLARDLGVGLPGGIPATEEVFLEILREFDVRISKNFDKAQVVRVALRAFADLSRLRPGGQYDFADMIYQPNHLPDECFPRYDYVFVDEAQDMAPAQMALVSRLYALGAVVALAGDPRQAIYGWRGAGVRSFDLAVQEYDAQVLPLTVTWRCGQAIVEQAQRLVPQIEAPPDAHEGEVGNRLLCAADLGPGDAVLCRNNAPLMALALDLVEDEVQGHRKGAPKVRMLGKDLSSAALGTLDRAGRLGRTLDDGLRALAGMARELYEDRPVTLSRVLDEVETARRVATSAARLYPDETPRAAAGAVLHRIFADARGGTVDFATIHGAKGLEWDRVVLLAPNKLPSQSALRLGGWTLSQELNLAYVGITRAKHVLSFDAPRGEDVVGSISARALAPRPGRDTLPPSRK